MKLKAFLFEMPRPLLWLLRLSVAVIFVYASIDKIANPGAFAQNVYYYRFLPLFLLHPFALYLPTVETVAGIGLLLPWSRRGAALICSGMTLVFIVGVSWALLRNLDISCGCFNTGEGHKVGLDLLIRDFLLLAGCLLLLFQRR